MLGWASRSNLGLGAAVDEVFLGELHQEIGIQLDIEFKVGRRRLCRLNVQVKRGVKQADSLHLVAFETPFELGL